MNRWFRFYNDALEDPKVQRLSGPLFKFWVNILCLASKHDGVLPPMEDIAFATRLPGGQASEMLESLSAAGLIDETNEGLIPHNWQGRQFKSDVSTDRVKRFRKRHGNVSATASETAPDSDSETDTERKKEATDEASKKVRGNMWKGGVRVAVGR